MADEIKVKLSIQVANGTFKERFDPDQMLIDQSTTVTMAAGCISVSTTAETIGLGDVTNPGVAWFTNLDPSNYVLLGSGTTGGIGNGFMRILAGESWVVRLTTGTTYLAEADTSPVQLRYTILGN